MKADKLIFIFFFISISNAFSQNLSLSELLKAREMTIGEVEEYLTKKQWKFFGGEEPTEEDFGVLNFAFNVGVNDRAESWIYYYFSDESELKRIAIQLLDEKKYNEYLNQIKNWGGKMISSKFEDKNIVKVYKGSTMTYIISTGNAEGALFGSTQTVYSILAMTNKGYTQSISKE